jgi:hypothetical protein
MTRRSIGIAAGAVAVWLAPAGAVWAQQQPLRGGVEENAPAGDVFSAGSDPVRCFDHALRDEQNALQAYQIVYGANWPEDFACRGEATAPELDPCWALLEEARPLIEQSAREYEAARHVSGQEQGPMVNEANARMRQAAQIWQRARSCFMPIFGRWTQNGGRYVPGGDRFNTDPGGGMAEPGQYGRDAQCGGTDRRYYDRVYGATGQVMSADVMNEFYRSGRVIRCGDCSKSGPDMVICWLRPNGLPAPPPQQAQQPPPTQCVGAPGYSTVDAAGHVTLHCGISAPAPSESCTPGQGALRPMLDAFNNAVAGVPGLDQALLQGSALSQSMVDALKRDYSFTASPYAGLRLIRDALIGEGIGVAAGQAVKQLGRLASTATPVLERQLAAEVTAAEAAEDTAVAQSMSCAVPAKRLQAATDLQRIARLKDVERGANSRINKIVYWLEEVARAGGDPAQALGQALDANGYTGLARELTLKNLLENWQAARDVAAFTPDNLKRMRAGLSAVPRRRRQARHRPHHPRQCAAGTGHASGQPQIDSGGAQPLDAGHRHRSRARIRKAAEPGGPAFGAGVAAARAAGAVCAITDPRAACGAPRGRGDNG